MTSIDTILFNLINQSWTLPFLDHLMPAMSSLYVWKPFMIALAAWAIIFGGSRGRVFVLTVVVGLILGDVILSGGLKRAFKRPRPRDVVEGVVVRSLSATEPRILHVFDPPTVTVNHLSGERNAHGNSFPSSHVLNLFMLATVVFYLSKSAGLLVGAIGLVVAWSRIYCGAHWPSDIPPSIALGILTGIAAVRSIEHILSRFQLRSGKK